MSTANPPASPNASPDSTAEPLAGPMRPPYARTAVLVFVGGCFLLLLNGQVFTNSLVFLGSVVASAAVWAWFLIRSKQEHHRRLGFYVLFIHVLFVIIFVTGLPEKYVWQQEFNNKANELREGSRLSGDQ